MSAQRTRYRVVVPSVGTAFAVAVVPDTPRHGTVRRIRVTIDSGEDPEASAGGSAAADIALELHEGGSISNPAAGLGGKGRRSVPLRKALGAAPAGTTLDIGAGTATDPALDVDYFLQPGDHLRVAVKLDADAAGLSDATAVVTLVIESHDR